MGVFNTIEHYDGSNWTVVSEGPLDGTEPFYQDIWGTSATNIYAAAMCSMPPGSPYGGCLDGFVYHYDGFTWTKIYQLAEGGLYGIWGISDTNDVVYAVGDNGTIVHYDETTWTVMDSGTEVTLHGIWFDSPTDVFVVGNIGTILHYDGIDWSPMPSGTTERLRAIWGSSPTNVYAVGNNGTILYYDGSSWTQMNIGYDSVIFNIWGDSETDIFASCNGAVFRYDGDYDSDGIPDASDNCLDTANPDQFDTYPPGGNNCGDACECEGDFDGDGDVKDGDIANFKASMGRGSLYRPCSICVGGSHDGEFCQSDGECPDGECRPNPTDPCYGDFDCDGDVKDGDIPTFKADMGRGPLYQPCPECSGFTCSY